MLDIFAESSVNISIIISIPDCMCWSIHKGHKGSFWVLLAPESPQAIYSFAWLHGISCA